MEDKPEFKPDTVIEALLRNQEENYQTPRTQGIHNICEGINQVLTMRLSKELTNAFKELSCEQLAECLLLADKMQKKIRAGQVAAANAPKVRKLKAFEN